MLEGFREQPDIEQITEDGLGVILINKKLFHGSGTANIKQFNTAEEVTIGRGVYLTSERVKAEGYGKQRILYKKELQPVVYEVIIENAKLADLRKKENVIKIMTGFKPILMKIASRCGDEILYNMYYEAVDAIEKNNIHGGNLKKITWNCGKEFTDYLISLGYDGLVSFEGGEGDIGNHDSYVIFDPTKAKIVKDEKLS
jgi:hypothetical protein